MEEFRSGITGLHPGRASSPRVIFALVALMALSACAEGAIPPPPSAEVREQLDVIAVVPAPFEQTIEQKPPVKGAGQGALTGAGQGALGSIGGGLYSGNPWGAALGIVFAPVAAVVGGVVGAIRARSDDEVDAADANLRAVLAGLNPNMDLRDRVIAAGRDSTDYDLVPRAEADHRISYRHLADEGLDSVLEIDVSDFRLLSDGNIDPDLQLVLIARARLVRAANDAELYRRTWGYMSNQQSYFDMAARNAKLLRAKIRQGYEKLADKIVYDLFIAELPEAQERTNPRPGTVWTVLEK